MPAPVPHIEEDLGSADAGNGALPRAGSLADAVRSCRGLAEEIGASGYGLFFMAAQGETRRLAAAFDDAFPGVSSESRSLSAPDTQRFARQVAATACPVWWRAEGASQFLSASARVWAVEAEPPLRHRCGIAFPVAIERGRSGAVIFTGSGMALDETRVCDIHARCCDLFDQVAKLRARDCDGPRPMSKRELECLRLTADGHTSEEIAAALGLSVHTANQYLANSTHKLNAVNRIHAVAKALRSGMIA